MKRLIDSYLISWKERKKRKPLIIRGARQVGKTYTVGIFGRKYFDHYIYINLEQERELYKVFDSKKPDNIINEITVLYNTPVIEGKTLLFIDEIQHSQNAIAGLRYFYEQKPDLHIIVAGSLLDHTLNEMQYSMPVGRVEFAYMYPLNFAEFLMALGESSIYSYISNYKPENEYSEAIHQKVSEYLRLYFFIGGMPEAVSSYIESRNLLEVERIHAEILTSLQFDFAKYGTRRQQELLKTSLYYIPNNIGRKIKYSNIDSSVHSGLLKESLSKLEMSRIVHLARKTSSVAPPITQYVNNNVYKPVFLDIGLANHLAQIKLTDIQNLTTDFEGALAEQFVGQEIIASYPFYIDGKLFYWAREAKNSNAEIDYLFQKGNAIYPVEVKAGKTGSLKSIHVFLAEKNKNEAIRLNMNLPTLGENLQASVRLKNENRILNYTLISLPLYYAGLLNTFEMP